jgi:hypothetical protein
MKNILFFLAFSCSLLQAQTYITVPASTTVADASVAENKAYAAFQNPAAVASVNLLTLGISYENKYIINELAVKSISFVLPTNFVNIAAQASYTGFNLYNELLGGIALSRNFGNVFQFGVQANYYSVYFAEVNKRYATFIPQLGAMILLSPAVNIGFSCFNPSQIVLKTASTPKIIPAVFSLGAKWTMSSSFDILLQLDKNLSAGYRIAGGFEYQLKNVLTIQTGAYHAQYLVPTLGFGCQLKGLKMNLSTNLHPVLGLNSRAAVYYSFGKK